MPKIYPFWTKKSQIWTFPRMLLLIHVRKHLGESSSPSGEQIYFFETFKNKLANEAQKIDHWIFISSHCFISITSITKNSAYNQNTNLHDVLSKTLIDKLTNSFRKLKGLTVSVGQDQTSRIMSPYKNMTHSIEETPFFWLNPP